MIAIVDAGPLYAAADSSDADHASSLEVLERTDLQLVIPTLVITEVTYMLGKHLGAVAEASFLSSMADFELEPPDVEDWQRIAKLVKKYADLPLGGTDASVVALAERLDTNLIITLDSDFSVVRPIHKKAFELLPGLL